MTDPFYVKLNRTENVYRAADPRAEFISVTPREGSNHGQARETQWSGVLGWPEIAAQFHYDPEDLTSWRAEIFEEIDLVTKAELAKGFEFGGKVFANNLESRWRYLAMYAMRDDPYLPYPIQFATLDDTDTIDIPDAATARMFCLASAGAFLTALAGGTAVKQQFNLLTTAAELGAWTDPRLTPPAEPIDEEQGRAAPDPSQEV